MICQELKCKKQESRDHVGTLCKRHYEILEKHGSRFSPLTYKTINKKNSVWENGCEHVRSIQARMINNWITTKKNEKGNLESMLKLIQEQIEEKDTKLQELVKMKNSRYVKN